MPVSTKTLSWDNLNTAATYDADKTLVDQIFNNNMLLKKVNEKKKTYPGGTFITVPTMYARGNGGAYSGYQTLSPTDKEILTNAVYTPAHYEVDVTISYTDILDTAGNTIVDLLDAKYQNAKLTMEYNLTAGLYAAGSTGPQTLNGLADAVAAAPTSGTYAGIDRASYSWWQNQYDSTTTLATLTIPKLQSLWGACSDGIIHPDLIVTTQAIFDAIYEKADAQMRLGNSLAASLGFTSINFNGVPLIVDKNCTASNLYMINTDFLYLKVHAQDDMKATPFLQPTTQLTKVKYITWTGQLVCSNPRYQGNMSALA